MPAVVCARVCGACAGVWSVRGCGVCAGDVWRDSSQTRSREVGQWAGMVEREQFGCGLPLMLYESERERERLQERESERERVKKRARERGTE